MNATEVIGNLIAADPKATIAFAAPFITFALNRILSPSVKLIHSTRHKFHYLINEPLSDKDGNQIRDSQSVVVQSISICNIGRASAKNVEVVFNWRPRYINIWPIRRYDEYTHPDGRFSIHLESLAPKEVFGIDLICINEDLPNIVTARSEEVESVEKILIPQIKLKYWQIVAYTGLFCIGLVTLVYIVLSVLAFALK